MIFNLSQDEVIVFYSTVSINIKKKKEKKGLYHKDLCPVYFHQIEKSGNKSLALIQPCLTYTHIIN